MAESGIAREALPRHVAIIMDGNGRWAVEQGRERIEGHARGVERVREIVTEASTIGIGQNKNRSCQKCHGHRHPMQ